MLKKRPGFVAGLCFAVAIVALLGAATAVVRVGQANTYTGGFLNDFSAAKFKTPTATVATLPAAAAGNANQVYLVTDGANLNDCTTGSGSVRVWCVSNASAWIAIPAPTDATLPTTDVTTNDASSTKHGFLLKSPADSTQFLNGGATPAFSAITTPVITAMTTLHANDQFINAAGTAYTLTNTNAAVDFGTTDPVITLGAAGTYLLTAYVRVEMVGATFAASRAVTVQIRRTNNTAADVAATFMVFNTPIVTTVTQTLETQFVSQFYTTANTNDSLTLFGDVSTVPTAGSVQVASAKLQAVRLY